MDKDRFAKKKFLVGDASGIEVSEHYRNPDYEEPQINPHPTTTEEGHLWLFRIDPTRSGLPAFVARFGHDDHQAVDIDWEGGDAGRKAFALSKPGYIGHKTQRVSSDPCQYKVHIEVPGVGLVFSGTLTVKILGLGVRVSSRLN
jgi:hypothetical protein